MFWGVRLQAGRKYSQEVSHSYQITKAVLETPVDGSNKNQNKRVHVMLLHDDEEFVLATLDNNNIERSMDIHFSEGEKVCLFLKGDGIVHLTGYIVDFGDDEDDEYSDEENPFVSADEFAKAAAKRSLNENGTVAMLNKKQKLMNEPEDEDDEEDEADEDFLGALDEEYDSFDDEMDDEMDDEEGDFDESEEDEEEQVAPPPKKLNGTAKPQAKTPQQQPQQKTPQQQKQQQAQQQSQKKVQQTPQNQQKGQQQQQQSQKKGQPQQQAQSAGQLNKVKQMDSGKKGVFTPPAKFVNHTKTPEGLEIYDTLNGTGPVAKKGKTVFVKYVGKLSNNKEFDRSTNKPFSFRLGAGDVISGWEKGIDGMKVGGKRRLFIPPKMAYGSQKTGPIPANSHLDFEVELVRVA